jgi:hypothetical protein
MSLKKSNHRILRQNKVDTYGAPVFAPDYNTTVLAAKMCTNSNENYMFIRSLCSIQKIISHEQDARWQQCLTWTKAML